MNDAYQFGYKPNSSTTCALICLYNKITEILKNDVLGVAVVSLDFSKAFDTISHSILINKLCELSFPPNFISWTRSYLSERTQRVILDNTLSDLLSISSGVPQGSLLGPFLFILYISHLITDHYVKYADDTTFLQPITKDINTSNKNLRETFANIQSESSNIKLHLNPSKSKLMIIAKTQDVSLLDPITIPNVDRVDKLKLLGMHLRSDLKWDDHISAIVTKSSRINEFMSCAQSDHYIRMIYSCEFLKAVYLLYLTMAAQSS